LRSVAGVLTLALLAPNAVAAQNTERHVFVTVLDRDGTPITGLTPEHFAVREDGRDRTVVRVQPIDTPMHVAVLVDTSFDPTLPIDAFRSARANSSSALPRFITSRCTPSPNGPAG
jgi:hypothetical protein